MASTIQIVPKWKHSYVETFVYDNTEVIDRETNLSDDAVKTVHVFRSGRGIDNLLVPKTDSNKFQIEFGKTDYRKYGQALMMPYASLAGGASTMNMRLMPYDATYANSNLYAYYRATENVVTTTTTVPGEDGAEDTVETVVKKTPVFQIMFRNTNIIPELGADNKLAGKDKVGLRTKNDIAAIEKTAVAPIPGKETPADGSAVPSWTGKYIATAYTTGRGVYGNNYRWRAVKNTDYEKDYSREMYTFEILNTEGGLSKVAAYVGTAGDCVLNNQSVRIDDVLNSYKAGTYPVYIKMSDSAVQDIYDAYVAFLEGMAADGYEVTMPSFEEFDPFFGQYIKTSAPYEYYQVVTVDDPAYPITDDTANCTIDSAVGISLNGGYDGLFSTFKNTDGSVTVGYNMPVTQEIVTAEGMDGVAGIAVGSTTVEALLYAKAFLGKMDRKILSTIRVPADYFCDGNYPFEGKRALARLLDARWDCLGYFDLGMEIETFSDSVFASIHSVYDGVFKTNAVSKNIQKFQVQDPFSRRWVWVTQTYKIAEQFPIHARDFGIQTAFAKTYARYTGIRPDTVTPSIDLWENELMSKLAERRLNYIEASDENVYQRGMQNTSQTITSDLLEESNMHVLFWLKRNIEKDVFNFQYHFSDPAERATFRQVTMAKYENIIGTMVSTLDIRFDMNEYEAERQIIHCYVEVTFRTLAKQGIIEIDVNKRQVEATLSTAS